MVPLRPTLTPRPGSPEELAAFARIQSRLAPMYRRVFSDDQAPRTVVVIPSLSLDPIELRKIRGVRHYEERMLCLLMLLRLPNANVVYVTSRPMHPSIIDYYIHLLPGVPGMHARNRLTLLDCDDESADPLTQKILNRPRLIQRISAAIPDKASSHLTCFNATYLERWEYEDMVSANNIPEFYIRQPLVQPLGEARSFTDVVCDIAKRVGRPLPFNSAEEFVRMAYCPASQLPAPL